MENKQIKFQENTGLKNKYCLVVGPNGAGKTTLLKQVNRRKRKSIFIADTIKKYSSLDSDFSFNPKTFSIVKEHLKRYGIDPSDFKIYARSRTSFFKEYFNQDIYHRILNKHSKFALDMFDSMVYGRKSFISEFNPIFIWYLIEKYTKFDPTLSENIYKEISEVKNLMENEERYIGENFKRGSFEILDYISKKLISDNMDKTLRKYRYYLLEHNRNETVPFEEIIYNEQLNDLVEKGLIVVKSKTKFSAGQRRLFEILLKASSNGVKNQTIIIDEIEMNLHPKWLREIIEMIDFIFINSKFLISTHSPVIVSGFDNKNILSLGSDRETWKIGRNNSDKENFGKNTSWILREVMGLEYTYASHAKKIVDQRAEEAIKRMEEFENAETEEK